MKRLSSTVTPLLFAALMFGAAVVPGAAQQPAITPPAPEAAVAVAPAPDSARGGPRLRVEQRSVAPTFNDRNAAAYYRHRSETITVSTLALVLIIIIVILLVR